MIISNEVEELPVESQSSETNKKLTTKVFTNNKQIIIDWRCYLDYRHVARETYSKNLQKIDRTYIILQNKLSLVCFQKLL